MTRKTFEKRITGLYRKILESGKLSEDDTRRLEIMKLMYNVGRFNEYQVIIRVADICTVLEIMTTSELIEYWK